MRVPFRGLSRYGLGRRGLMRGIAGGGLLWLLVLSAGCANYSRSLSNSTLTVRTNGERERVEEIAHRARFISNIYRELFDVEPSSIGHLEIIDTVPEGEVRVGTKEPGRYEGARRRIVLNDTADDELLLHELAHHFVRGIKTPLDPWVNEGLAVYLAWSGVGDDRLALGGIPIHHVTEIVKEARRDELRPLSKLLNMSSSEFYDPDEETRARNYSQAWSLVYFLLEEALPREETPKRIRQLLAMPNDQVISLSRRYERFWRGFDVLETLVKQLREEDSLRRHLAAIEVGILGETQGIGPLLHTACHESEHRGVRLAAIHAVGTILLRVDPSQRPSIERKITRYHDPAKGLEDPVVEEAFDGLWAAVRLWDRQSFFVDFALALVGDTVYPSRTYSRYWN